MSWKANLDRDRKAFLMHQSEVYGNFRSYMRSNDPIVRCPELDAHTSGYVLAMRFDSALTDVVADQSNRISTAIDCVRYSASNIHSTITEYDRREGPKDKLDLKKAAAVADTLRESFMRFRPVINFQEWLMNQSSVILAGEASPEFTEGVSSLLRAAGRQGLDLRWPWGSHITVARFCRSATSAETREHIMSAITSVPPPGAVWPVRVEVCYYEFGACSYRIKPLETLMWEKVLSDIISFADSDVTALF